MATSKKKPEATTKKKPAPKAGPSATPAMGGNIVGRPQAIPFKKPGEQPSEGPLRQIDPLYLYDIQVFTGTAWILIGSVWFDAAQTEYWGLFQAWPTYNVGPNLWIYPTAYANTVADLKAFKAKVNLADPNHNSSFLKVTSTAV